MKLVIFCVLIFFLLITTIIMIVDFKYYEQKLPKESLEEIEEEIRKCNVKIQETDDMMKISEFLDMKEYWEQQKNKILIYHKKHGNK